MLDSAIAFAATAHAGQKRKWVGVPYIVHPIEVMTLVADHGEIVMTAAVLHDVIEDTPVTEREILRRFGANVARLVVELTEVEVPGNRAIRKAAERDRLALVSADAQTIKCADLISNTSTIVRHDPKFARVYLAEKQALLVAMTKADPRLHQRATETMNLGFETLALSAPAPC